MKKRAKRRLDFERYEQLKKSGKTVDSKLRELVEQYDALNETLKKELPRLSALTVKVGHMCLGSFVNIQTSWFAMWKDKIEAALPELSSIPETKDITSVYQADFKFVQESFTNIGIINPAYRGRNSASTTPSIDDGLLKVKTNNTASSRGRGITVNGNVSGDIAPCLPTPDFVRRHSGQFSMSPTTLPSPHQYYYQRDYYPVAGGAGGSASPVTSEQSRTAAAQGGTRPSTGKSYDSSRQQLARQNSSASSQARRDSNSTYNSQYPPHDGREGRRFSGLFHSALPMPDTPDEASTRSRASSRERSSHVDGYNVLWLAASLFEFNIETTKHEAGYPYLTYQAGEVSFKPANRVPLC